MMNDISNPWETPPAPLLPANRWEELALRDELKVGVAELVYAGGLDF